VVCSVDRKKGVGIELPVERTHQIVWLVQALEVSMAVGLSELLSVQQSALRLREARGELLASNIANADTPNYKARDINFSAAMQQATQAVKGGTQTSLPLAATSGVSLSGKSAGTVSGAAIQYRSNQQGSIDGNDVDTDSERMQFADNAVRYEATVTLMTAQIRNMLAVVQG
jgi:flagellar basal-body rod protein FlgB